MNLYEKILNGEERISLVGLGYVGMPIAVAFAKKWIVSSVKDRMFSLTLRDFLTEKSTKTQDTFIGDFNYGI